MQGPGRATLHFGDRGTYNRGFFKSFCNKRGTPFPRWTSSCERGDDEEQENEVEVKGKAQRQSIDEEDT